MVRRILLIAAGTALCSCSHIDIKGLFAPTGDGVEQRFEQSREISHDLKAESADVQENYMFYVATDPHIDRTHVNLDVFNDSFRNDGNASFAVILGDCIDVKDNLETYLEALTYRPESHRFDYPVFHVLGNHDVYFNGWDDFKEIIGPSVYWFEAVFPGGKDLYISLDTATGTLGRRQTEWFRSFLSENSRNYRHCIILTHTNFFYTDRSQNSSGNMPLEESFALIDFLGIHDVSLVLQGHDHYREDLTYDNVRYTIVGAIRDDADAPEYLKVSVGSDGISLDWKEIIR